MPKRLENRSISFNILLFNKVLHSISRRMPSLTSALRQKHKSCTEPLKALAKYFPISDFSYRATQTQKRSVLLTCSHVDLG